MTLRGHSNKNDASNGSAGSNSNNNNTATDGQRHGSTESSGAESWRSTDTVRGPFGNMKINTANKKLQYVFPMNCYRLWVGNGGTMAEGWHSVNKAKHTPQKHHAYIAPPYTRGTLLFAET